MNVEYIGGMVCGVICGLLLVMILLKITKKDGNMKCKFDERQELARGRAFKYGFFTVLVCNFLYAMLDEAADLPLTGGAAAGIIILIGAIVMISYSIWQDAYFSLNESRRRMMVVFGVVGLINLVQGISNLRDGGAFQDGVLNLRIINLLCGVLFLLIFAELALKRMVDRRNGEN